MRAVSVKQEARKVEYLVVELGVFGNHAWILTQEAQCSLGRFGLDWHILAERSSYGRGRLNTRPARQNRRATREKSFHDFHDRIYRSCQRARLGDTPVTRRKCRARWLWSENPTARAISDN